MATPALTPESLLATARISQQSCENPFQSRGSVRNSNPENPMVDGSFLCGFLQNVVQCSSKFLHTDKHKRCEELAARVQQAGTCDQEGNRTYHPSSYWQRGSQNCLTAGRGPVAGHTKVNAAPKPVVISRTRLWLVGGWGCQGRRLSRGLGSLGRQLWL